MSKPGPVEGGAAKTTGLGQSVETAAQHGLPTHIFRVGQNRIVIILRIIRNRYYTV